MNLFASQLSIVTIMCSFVLNSCRPPNYADDAMNRGMRVEGGEVYSDSPGQSNSGIRLDNVLDPRPDVIKQADNPNYDRTGGAFGRMWNAIVNNVSIGGASPKDLTNFQPEPSSSEIDNYDIQGGRVNIDPTDGIASDPEVEEMRQRQAQFEAEIKRKNDLRGQRDYLEGKAKADIQRFTEKKVEGISTDLIKKTESLKSEIDAAIVEHNNAVDKMIYDEVEEVGGNSTPTGYQFRTAPHTVNGQRVRAAQYAINSAQKSVSQMSGAAKDRGQVMLSLAQNAVVVADKAYVSGDQAGGDFAIELATTAVDVGLSLIPGVGFAKDVVEAASGYSMVTGKKLSGFERTMAVVGILTAGYGSALKYAGKAVILADVFKVGKAAEEAAEVARATSKATEIVDSAQKVGMSKVEDVKAWASATSDLSESRLAKVIFETQRITPASSVQKISPDVIKFSQSNVNDAAEITASMRSSGWVGGPIDVVKISDGTLVTADNTRVLAASRAGIDVETIVRSGSESLSAQMAERFTTSAGVPNTWEEAVRFRIGNQNRTWSKLYPNGSYVTKSLD